ncbi:MAG TPA: VOC family protein [Acidimicrobiia bacterium]|jgi:catechol 2,3-dioxygenase-like lactoylglutathione lyase family enzyme
MGRVTGIGGVFFRSDKPKELQDWYVQHLGLSADTDGYVVFRWSGPGSTVWAPFPADTDYFGSGGGAYMINYRVDDLDGVLERLRADGVEVDPKVEELELGKFGWATDPAGNRFELWEPAEGY